MTHPLVESLGLVAHPEGGWYRRTWTAPVSFSPDGYPGPRPAATAITFLLTGGDRSRWHRVASDELWLWQGLGAVRLTYGGTGAAPEAGGHAVLDGGSLQALVPGGTWQTAAPLTATGALVACVVAPGFDFEDLEMS